MATSIRPKDLPSAASLPGDTAVIVDTGEGVFKTTPSAIAEQAVFVQVGTGAVSRTAENKARDIVSVLDFGAKGDGSTDDTDAIQAALDSGARAIYVPRGTYCVSSALSITATLRLYGEGTIKETVRLDSTIVITADDVDIEGLTFEGPETLSAWAAGDAAYRQVLQRFISFDTVTGCSVTNIRTSGKRGAVNFDDSFRCSVVGVRHSGFFGPISGSVADANFHTAVRIDGGGQHSFSDITATECGSAVLIGKDAPNNTITKVTGHDFHDNGIYNSSGNGSTFSACSLQSGKSSGIKARGSDHTVSNNVIKGMLIGITMTGNGVTADTFGANGSGSSATGNTIRDCTASGIFAGVQDSLLMRDIVIANNTITGSTGVDGNAPILVTVEQGANVVGNIVDGCVADYAIIVAGQSGDPAINCTVDGNTVIKTTADAIRVIYLDYSSISGNKFNAVTGVAVEARFCNNCSCIGNIVNGNNQIRFNDDYTSTGNYIADNKVSVYTRIVADMATNTIRLLSSNLKASKTYDWPSLTTATQQSTTITVTGAKLGDEATASMSVDLSGTRLWAEVTAADTVTIYQRNDTGATVDLASGTLTVSVRSTP